MSDSPSSAPSLPPPSPSSDKPTQSRVAFSYILALVAVIGGYFLANSFYQGFFSHSSDTPHFPWPAVLAGAVILLLSGVAGWLLGNHLPTHSHDSPHQAWKKPFLWLFAIVAGAGVHWFGTSLEHWLLHDLHCPGWLLGTIGLLLNILGSWLLYHNWPKPRQRKAMWNAGDPTEGQPGIRKRKTIISFVSSFRTASELGTLSEGPGQDEWTLKLGAKEYIFPVSGGISTVEEKEKELNSKWNTLQLLRGLRPHLGTLQTVYLIASADEINKNGTTDPGSGGQVPDIVRFLISVLKNEPKAAGLLPNFHYLTPTKEAPTFPGLVVPFANVKMLYEAIEIHLAKEKAKGVETKDIIVDATGGQKTTSIAAALATLNSDLAFQYVDTNNTDRVGEFDWTIENAADAPHGPDH